VKGLIGKVRRAAKRKVPIAVGFGLSSPNHVHEVIRSGADGAIVGSAIVNIIAKNKGEKEKMLREIRGFVAGLKEATSIR